MATTMHVRRSHLGGGVTDRTVMRSVPMSLGLVGVLTVGLGAWGAIVPYVGPTFGFSGDGTGSWTWSLSHSVLALVPGALACFAGLVIWSRGSRTTVGGGRVSLASAGFLAAVCGAWFAIGPFAWAVIDDTHPYFVGASSLHELAYLVGYALGVGLLLVGCGAFALGWAVRHQRQPVLSVPEPSAMTPSYAAAPQAASHAAAPAAAPAPQGVPMAPGAPDATSTGQATRRGGWFRRRPRTTVVSAPDQGRTI